jgi:hypothetical protein
VVIVTNPTKHNKQLSYANTGFDLSHDLNPTLKQVIFCISKQKQQFNNCKLTGTVTPNVAKMIKSLAASFRTLRQLNLKENRKNTSLKIHGITRGMIQRERG